MRLDEVAGGSIYVDTNVLYMYLRADHTHLPIIRTFLDRVVSGDIEAFISIPVLDELFYRLLLARIKETTGLNPLDKLRTDLTGAIATHSDVIASALRKLISLPHFNLVGVDAADFHGMLDNITSFSLLPRDALHIAILQRLNISAIASDDTDFDRVRGVERYWIINPPT